MNQQEENKNRTCKCGAREYFLGVYHDENASHPFEPISEEKCPKCGGKVHLVKPGVFDPFLSCEDGDCGWDNFGNNQPFVSLKEPRCMNCGEKREHGFVMCAYCRKYYDPKEVGTKCECLMDGDGLYNGNCKVHNNFYPRGSKAFNAGYAQGRSDQRYEKLVEALKMWLDNCTYGNETVASESDFTNLKKLIEVSNEV